MSVIPLATEVETFCLAIAGGATIAGAFRQAFPERAARVTGHRQKGARILDRPAVRARLAALGVPEFSSSERQPIADVVLLTVADGGDGCDAADGAGPVDRGEPVDSAGAASTMPAAVDAFCEAIAAGASQVEAFRAAFPDRAARVLRPSERARKLMRRPEIAARVEELRAIAGSSPHQIAPPALASLEAASAIAFDARRSDLERLISLRVVADGLRVLAGSAQAPTVRVTITITLQGAAAPRGYAACDESKPAATALGTTIS